MSYLIKLILLIYQFRRKNEFGEINDFFKSIMTKDKSNTYNWNRQQMT